MAHMTDSSPFPVTDIQQNQNGHADNDVLMADSADNHAAFTANAQTTFEAPRPDASPMSEVGTPQISRSHDYPPVSQSGPAYPSMNPMQQQQSFSNMNGRTEPPPTSNQNTYTGLPTFQSHPNAYAPPPTGNFAAPQSQSQHSFLERSMKTDPSLPTSTTINANGNSAPRPLTPSTTNSAPPSNQNNTTSNTLGGVSLGHVIHSNQPHGSPTRVYLNGRVTPVLLEGMKYLAKHEPERPLAWLSEFLRERSRELEGEGGGG